MKEAEENNCRIQKQASVPQFNEDASSVEKLHVRRDTENTKLWGIEYAETSPTYRLAGW